MVINKEKTYSGISLDEIKTHLKIYSGDTANDAEIESLIKVAVTDVENYIQFDVVPTICHLEDYNVNRQFYEIAEPSVVLSGITATTFNSDNTVNTVTVIPLSGVSIFKYNQFSLLKFQSSINADKLDIVYSVGTTTVKPNILHAIKLRTGYYFDADKNETSTTNIRETKAFQKLLSTEYNLLN